MKTGKLSILMWAMWIGLSVLFMSFTTSHVTNNDIAEKLCGARWLYSAKITMSGTEKAKKDEKKNYLLFNPDNTAIIFEKGQTSTANWIYNDVTKSLTINFIGGDQIREYVLFSISKKELILIDNTKNTQFIYKR